MTVFKWKVLNGFIGYSTTHEYSSGQYNVYHLDEVRALIASRTNVILSQMTNFEKIKCTSGTEKRAVIETISSARLHSSHKKCCAMVSGGFNQHTASRAQWQS